MHLFKRSVKGGVYFCPAQVVLKHELPTDVFLEIKAAKITQNGSRNNSSHTGTKSNSITERASPPEDFKCVAENRRDAVFRCR